jgi:SAM-dependent methyltransferase
MQNFMSDEAYYMRTVPEGESKTFVDLGSGYGRVLPLLSQVARDVLAVEINPAMFEGLEEEAAKHSNVTAVQGDFLKLPDILPPELKRPVFLILQNSLGTIEFGDSQDALDVVAGEARKRQGELILGLFRQQALQEWGLKEVYGKKERVDVIGHVDLEKTDFENGLFVTDQGYTSKWWTDEDLDRIRSLGHVFRGATFNEYALLHLTFPDNSGPDAPAAYTAAGHDRS